MNVPFTYGKTRNIPATDGARLLLALRELWSIEPRGTIGRGEGASIILQKASGAGLLWQMYDNGGELNVDPINVQGEEGIPFYGTMHGGRVPPLTVAYRVAQRILGKPIDWDTVIDESLLPEERVIATSAPVAPVSLRAAAIALLGGEICRFDPLNPCWADRPGDVAGKHWGGSSACVVCTARAALDQISKRTATGGELGKYFEQLAAISESDLRVLDSVTSRLFIAAEMDYMAADRDAGGDAFGIAEQRYFIAGELADQVVDEQRRRAARRMFAPKDPKPGREALEARRAEVDGQLERMKQREDQRRANRAHALGLGRTEDDRTCIDCGGPSHPLGVRCPDTRPQR